MTLGLEYIDSDATTIITINNVAPLTKNGTATPADGQYMLTTTPATATTGEIVEIKLLALASADPAVIDITFDANVTNTFDFTASELNNTGEFFMYENDTNADSDTTRTGSETSGEKTMDPMPIGPYLINAAAISVDVPAVPTTQYNTVLRFRAPKGDFAYGHYIFTETIPDEYLGDISFQPVASVSAYVEGGNADGTNSDLTVTPSLSADGKTMTVDFDDVSEMNDKYVYITIPMVNDTITTTQTALLPCTAKLEAGPSTTPSDPTNTIILDPEFNEQVNFIAQPSFSTVTKNLVI